MYDLFTRTVSQALQALLPIAFCLTWLRRAGAVDPVRGVRLGLIAALPATAVAAYWFQTTSRQAQWEAALALAALAPAIWFARQVRRAPPRTYRLAFALVTTLLVVRQTMEIAVVLGMGFQLRSLDALLAIGGGIAVALVVVGLWFMVGHRLPDPALAQATRVFALLFVGQLTMYAVHESAEAGLLPWSGVLHAATEPYGPDGVYGRYVSALLFAIPLAWAVATVVKARRPACVPAQARPWTTIVRRVATAVGLLVAAGAALTIAVKIDRPVSYASAPAAPAPARDAAAIAASPHLLFRHTIVDQHHSRLTVAPLDARQISDRASAELNCERISYAAGRGICLHAEHGLFTTYQALFFDRTFKPMHTIKLAGRPSRTRVSPDGRVGAITVFVTGEMYAGSPFSTRTTIVDMATGDELGDLEQFSTWRNGVRFKAADFNFWGVTFARDSNVFYATLRTAATFAGGQTYLVRGDLGLRKLTVLSENVECPSLSPDNRLIAFKKRVGWNGAPWRFSVLDLATMTERPIAAETRSVDDQIEWLDNDHVLYAIRRAPPSTSFDVWVAPLDNGSPAKIFMPEAESPIVVR